MTRALCLGLTLSALGIAAPVAAQPLFVQPGEQRAALVATTTDPLTKAWAGMDPAGYVYTGDAQYAACWHPDDPVATKVVLRASWLAEGAFLPSGQVVALMDWAHDGMRLFGWKAGPSVPTTFKTGVFRCADHEGGVIDDTRFDSYGTTAEVTTADGLPAWLGGDRWVVRPGGDTCRIPAENDALWCAEVRAGGVTFVKEIDVADVVLAIDVDPTLGAPVTNGGVRPTASWSLRLPTFLPDGRTLVVAQVSYTSGAASWGPFSWLVERAAPSDGGAWRVRYAPPKPRDGENAAGTDGTLAELRLLTTVDGLDALVGWPVMHADRSAEVVGDTEAGPVVRGGRGVGAWLLPEDPRATTTRTWGWTLPLGEAFRCSPGVDVVDNCQEGGGAIGVDGDKLWERFETVHRTAIRLPGGIGVPTLAGVEERAGTSGTTRWGLVRLMWDEDALDMDEDGLARGDERRLGTSDWLASSDHGRVPDGLEVAMGKDPDAPGDDPSFAHPPRYWAESRLVERFLPDRDPDASFTDGYGFLGGYGPLCHTDTCGTGPADRDAALACRLANGDVVDYGQIGCGDDDDRIMRVWPSQDGTYVVVRRADGLVAIDHATGRERLLVPAATVDAELAAVPSTTGWASDVTVVPGDVDTIFVAFTGVGEVDLARIHVVDGDDLRLVYDHAEARCDSRMGGCDDRPTPEAALRSIPQNDLSTKGYGGSGLMIGGVLPGPRRLVVSVLGRFGRWMIGVHPSDPPIVLRHGADLAFGAGLGGLPRYVLPTGHGDFTTGPGFIDAWGNPLATTVERAGPWDSPPVVIPPHHLGLGDQGVVFTMDASVRAYEYVPYDTSEAEPGDVFTLANESFTNDLGAPRDARWRLYRSGPRGGIAPVWGFALGSVELRGPTGMDVNARGELCIADKHDGRLRVFVPFAASLAPNTPRFDFALDEGAVDCLMEPDGTVWVLQDRGASPRVARYELFVEEPVETVAVTAIDPVGLVRTPDGGFEVLDRAAGELGRVHRASGERLDLDASPCVTGAGAAPWRVFGVERPDGWLVVNCLVETASGLVTFGGDTRVVHPDHGEALPLTSNTSHTLSLLARLPGGAAVDPWTGDALDPEALTPTPPPGVTPPASPVTGTPVPDGGGASGGDGGCGAGGPPLTAGALVALLALLARARRPRAPSPPAPSENR
ncbi:MAG: hypothetical protein IT385_27235 [Deltaproteobacteria bacterium]|nr:hypothetical protein [Deltaproteobacteria bacterium]